MKSRRQILGITFCCSSVLSIAASPLASSLDPAESETKCSVWADAKLSVSKESAAKESGAKEPGAKESAASKESGAKENLASKERARKDQVRDDFKIINGVMFNTTVDIGLTHAMVDQKPLLVYMMDPNSSACQRFESEILVRQEVKNMLLSEYDLSMVARGTPNAVTLEKDFGCHAYPHFIVFAPDGKMLGRWYGEPNSGASFVRAVATVAKSAAGTSRQKIGEPVTGFVTSNSANVKTSVIKNITPTRGVTVRIISHTADDSVSLTPTQTPDSTSSSSSGIRTINIRN